MPLSVVMDSLDDVADDIKELYTERSGKFHLTGIVGVKSQEDVDKISEGLRKEREDHKSTKAKLHEFDGLDAAEVRTKLATIPELELRAKGDPEKFEEKLEELVAARLSTAVGPLELENKKLKETNTELATKVEQAEIVDRRRRISDAAMEVAQADSVQESAYSDVLLFSQSVLTISDDGSIVVGPNNFGVPEGLEPKDMLAEMKPKKAHWWPPTVGGDSRGSGSGGAGDNPFSADNWNMTEQGKIYTENPERAAQLAKAAGTSVGGPRPAAKK